MSHLRRYYAPYMAESIHSVYSGNTASAGAVALFSDALDVSFDHDALNSSTSQMSGRRS